MKTLVTSDAPQPIGPYSQGIEIDGFIFLSGQIGIVPKTGDLAEGLTAQTKQVLENLSAVLKSAGAPLSSVVKTTVYLRNLNEFSQFNQIYSEYFHVNPPARTTVEVSALPRNALIEIDVIARK